MEPNEDEDVELSMSSAEEESFAAAACNFDTPTGSTTSRSQPLPFQHSQPLHPDYEVPAGFMTETEVYQQFQQQGIRTDRYGFVEQQQLMHPPLSLQPSLNNNTLQQQHRSYPSTPRGFTPSFSPSPSMLFARSSCQPCNAPASPAAASVPPLPAANTTLNKSNNASGSSLLGAGARGARAHQRRLHKWLQMLGPQGAHLGEYMAAHPAKFKERVRKGIPEEVRGLSWQLLSGGRLLQAANPGVYLALQEHVEVEIDSAIMRDLNRTFPHHVFFMYRQGPGQKALYNVLRAYAAYDRKVGYVQGMGFLAAVLLLHMGEEETFWTLVALMKGPPLQQQEDLEQRVERFGSDAPITPSAKAQAHPTPFSHQSSRTYSGSAPSTPAVKKGKNPPRHQQHQEKPHRLKSRHPLHSSGVTSAPSTPTAEPNQPPQQPYQQPHQQQHPQLQQRQHQYHGPRHGTATPVPSASAGSAPPPPMPPLPLLQPQPVPQSNVPHNHLLQGKVPQRTVPHNHLLQGKVPQSSVPYNYGSSFLSPCSPPSGPQMPASAAPAPGEAQASVGATSPTPGAQCATPSAAAQKAGQQPSPDSATLAQATQCLCCARCGAALAADAGGLGTTATSEPRAPGAPRSSSTRAFVAHADSSATRPDGSRSDKPPVTAAPASTPDAAHGCRPASRHSIFERSPVDVVVGLAPVTRAASNSGAQEELYTGHMIWGGVGSCSQPTSLNCTYSMPSTGGLPTTLVPMQEQGLQRAYSGGHCSSFGLSRASDSLSGSLDPQFASASQISESLPSTPQNSIGSAPVDAATQGKFHIRSASLPLTPTHHAHISSHPQAAVLSPLQTHNSGSDPSLLKLPNPSHLRSRSHTPSTKHTLSQQQHSLTSTSAGARNAGAQAASPHTSQPSGVSSSALSIQGTHTSIQGSPEVPSGVEQAAAQLGSVSASESKPELQSGTTATTKSQTPSLAKFTLSGSTARAGSAPAPTPAWSTSTSASGPAPAVEAPSSTDISGRCSLPTTPPLPQRADQQHNLPSKLSRFSKNLQLSESSSGSRAVGTLIATPNTMTTTGNSIDLVAPASTPSPTALLSGVDGSALAVGARGQRVFCVRCAELKDPSCPTAASEAMELPLQQSSSTSDTELSANASNGQRPQLYHLSMGDSKLARLAGTMMQSGQRFPLDSMYVAGMPLLQQSLFQLQGLIKDEVPRLAKLFAHEGLEVAMFSTCWFNTIFAYCLPFSHLLRIWDIFMLEGLKIVFRSGIVLLKAAEKRLTRTGSVDDMVESLGAKNIPSLLPPPSTMIKMALKIKVSKRLADLEQQWEEMQKAQS